MKNKKKSSRKIITMITVMAMVISMCLPCFAVPTYSYTASKDSETTTTRINYVFTSKMSGTSNYLRLSSYGVYSTRGAGRSTTPGHMNTSYIKLSSITSTEYYSDTIGSGKNFYAVLCCGYYKTSSSNAWSGVTSREVPV